MIPAFAIFVLALITFFVLLWIRSLRQSASAIPRAARQSSADGAEFLILGNSSGDDCHHAPHHSYHHDHGVPVAGHNAGSHHVSDHGFFDGGHSGDFGHGGFDGGGHH